MDCLYTFLSDVYLLPVRIRPCWANKTVAGQKPPATECFATYKPLATIFIQTRKFRCSFISFLVVFYIFQFRKSPIFHTLFMITKIFSTNPVPTSFFIIVCSSSGLQVCLCYSKNRQLLVYKYHKKIINETPNFFNKIL